MAIAKNIVYGEYPPDPKIAAWAVFKSQDHPAGMIIDISADKFSLSFVIDAEDLREILRKLENDNLC